MARRAGFTLIELLVVITIIGILAAIALPNYIRAKDKAKEVQVKSAVKSIQVALERYMVDSLTYPDHILGGDTEGWANWHLRFDEPNPVRTGVPQNAWQGDVLIMYSYLEAYPENPFVDNGNAIIAQTGDPTGPGGTHQAGDGDPRFGFRGTIMGNGLEHPALFDGPVDDSRDNPGQPDPLVLTQTKLTLDTVCADSGAKGFAKPADNPGGMHYTFGGRRAPPEVQQNGTTTIYTHWPGNFFFRAFPDRSEERKGWTISEPNWWVKGEVNRYIMGAYGSFTSEGTDLIRLENTNSSGQQTYYQLPPPWNNGSTAFSLLWDAIYERGGGMPEIAGGGDDTVGPWLPPNRSAEFFGSWIYGAPDGYNDGVILILTAGDEVQAY